MWYTSFWLTWVGIGPSLCVCVHHPCLIQAYWGNGDSVFCVYAVLVLPRSLSFQSSFCCCCCLCSGSVSSWLCVIPFPQCTDCARQTDFSARVFFFNVVLRRQGSLCAAQHQLCCYWEAILCSCSLCPVAHLFCMQCMSSFWFFGIISHLLVLAFWVLAFFSNFVTVSPISLSAGCFSLCRKHEEWWSSQFWIHWLLLLARQRDVFLSSPVIRPETKLEPSFPLLCPDFKAPDGFAFDIKY